MVLHQSNLLANAAKIMGIPTSGLKVRNQTLSKTTQKIFALRTTTCSQPFPVSRAKLSSSSTPETSKESSSQELARGNSPQSPTQRDSLEERSSARGHSSQDLETDPGTQIDTRKLVARSARMVRGFHRKSGGWSSFWRAKHLIPRNHVVQFLHQKWNPGSKMCSHISRNTEIAKCAERPR